MFLHWRTSAAAAVSCIQLKVDQRNAFLPHVRRSTCTTPSRFSIDCVQLSFFHDHSALMAKLEAKLGRSSETLDVIRQEMERDYYSADPRLVDPLLTRYEGAR